MPRSARLSLLVGGGLLGLLLVVVAATLLGNGADVPRGVRVAGTDIGGLSRSEARERLSAGLAGRSTGTVRLAAAGQELELDPQAAGLSFDLDATLDDAADAGPLDRLTGLFGTQRDVQPVAAVDPARLTAALERTAVAVDRPAREGAVTFEGTTPTPVLPQTGRVLQVGPAVEVVTRTWLTASPVELPVQVTGVVLTEQAVRAAVTDLAAPAVAGALTLTTEKGELVLAPVDTAAVLTFVSGTGGVLAPQVDGAALLERLADRVDPVQDAPADATFRVAGGKPVLVPAVQGRTVSAERLQPAVLEAVGTPGRTAPLELAVTEPEVTTAEATALGITEEIGTFTTEHPCCAPRVQNIQRMADLVDGELVLPGETYSLNDDVGERTRARGFVDAPQISNGEFVDGVGGGVSQFTTTMYNATFFAGMQDVEHTPHSYYISRYPEGREATITFPAPDLKWQNDSPTGVFVSTSYTGRSITVTLYGTKRYDEVLSLSSGRERIRSAPTVTEPAGPGCSSSSGRSGFDITITRVMKVAGAEVRRTSADHRYQPEPRRVCVVPPPVPAPPVPMPPPAPTPPVPAPTPGPVPAAVPSA